MTVVAVAVMVLGNGSSGIFGFPKDLCAKIMFQTVLEYAREKGPASTVSEVHFTNFDEVTTKLFEAECQQLVASMRYACGVATAATSTMTV